jgi:hypothetical protein
MELLTQNSKLKKTSKELGVQVFNFGIPAYKSKTGKLTCPFAKDCIKYCYAQKGAYIWGNVSPAFEQRYEATKKDDFIEVMGADIRKKKVDFLRIHDSGDYYSPAYLKKWLQIAENNPQTKFYSYTKSVPLFEGITLPDNFDVIFSQGSTVDGMINPDKMRHSKIFKSADELIISGYVDASKIDLYATKWFSKNHKVGLIFH